MPKPPPSRSHAQQVASRWPALLFAALAFAAPEARAATDGPPPSQSTPADPADDGAAAPAPLEGAERARARTATLPAGDLEARLGLGWRAALAPPLRPALDVAPAAELSLAYGISDRLQWRVLAPAFAWRFGEAGGIEVVLSGGMPSWGVGFSSAEGPVATYTLGAQVDAFVPLSSAHTIVVTAGTGTFGRHSPVAHVLPTTWDARVAVGASWRLADVATLHVGIGLGGDVLVEGRPEFARHRVSLGAVQRPGLRALPLLQVHVLPNASLDAYWTLSSVPDASFTAQEVLAGFTWVF